jgi:hypothetical protein
MSKCNSVATPLEANPKCENLQGCIPPFEYRAAIGALLYLSTSTRPDIAYSVGYYARFTEDPKGE